MVVPKVSIVIPVFNSGPLLRDTLAGIQQQTFQDFEIIVVDDGSTDNTQKLVTSADSSIRFYRQTNQGPAVARNRGVSLAQVNLSHSAITTISGMTNILRNCWRYFSRIHRRQWLLTKRLTAT